MPLIEENPLLVLSRKEGQSIIISDDIKLTFLRFKGSQIAIGIEAPKDVKVFREEIYDQLGDGLPKEAEGLDAVEIDRTPLSSD